MYFQFKEEVSIEGRPGGFALDFPDCCCNCGSIESISWIDTALVRTMFIPIPVMAGSELRWPVRLPSCPQCIATMHRIAPTLTGLILLTILLFLLASFPSWFIAGIFVETGPQRFESTLGIALVVTAIVHGSWWGVIRRPRNDQSTAFQPVRLAGVKRRWFIGNIRQIKLAFTNDTYRARFVESNAGLIREKVLRVE